MQRATDPHEHNDEHQPPKSSTDSRREAEAAAAAASSAASKAAAAGALEDLLLRGPPARIAPDGTFVRPPPPGPAERRRFFERSVARHGLLLEDLGGGGRGGRAGGRDRGGGAGTTGGRAGGGGGDGGGSGAPSDDEGDESEVRSGEKAAPAAAAAAAARRVHPLALASARLQSGGLSELNRAINLSGLVSSGEYFGMSNVVDPSLLAAATAPTAGTSKASAEAADGKAKPGTEASSSSSSGAAAAAKGQSAGGAAAADDDKHDEHRIRSLYVLRRKRSQLVRSGRLLGLHSRRLRAAAAAQSRPDARLRQLRTDWRLAAPEHGSRALPHPARPDEPVAVDVDAYRGGGAFGGRLAARVPRYATVELRDGYPLEPDLERWERRFRGPGGGSGGNDEDSGATAMDVDPPAEGEGMVDDPEAGAASALDREKGSGDPETWTVAEPFAVADPRLGRIDAEPEDPSQTSTAMLSLQFDVVKPSTGFRQSASLRPAVPSASSSKPSKSATIPPDERLLFSLQHSLLAAQLFESIRQEVVPEDDEVDAAGEAGLAAAAAASRRLRGPAPGSVAWISQDSPSSFLPPPNLLGGAGGAGGLSGLAPLAVVHCHEGEVEVQLDREYTLRAKLVEAGQDGAGGADAGMPNPGESADSGSQTPQQLLVLCRTLLYHAEERFHEYAKKRAAQQSAPPTPPSSAARGPAPGTAEAGGGAGDVHARRRWIESPRILQSCVSLGSKLLMEERVRATLARVQQWLRQQTATAENGNSRSGDDGLQVTWLSLSVLDRHSVFALAFRHWVADATLVGEEITVTSTVAPEASSTAGAGHEYRKVRFHSEAQLELYLKMALRRMLLRKDDATGGVATG